MAALPAHFLRGVVAIGESDEGGIVDYKASGFLLAYPTDIAVEDIATGKSLGQEHQIFLVTNRHVLNRRDTVIMRFNNSETGPAVETLE